MIFHKLELDIMQNNDLSGLDLAFKYNLPAVVVHPLLVAEAIRIRGRIRGRFNIITTVDWPKGEAQGVSKFRGIPVPALEADGFEVCLTPHTEHGPVQREAVDVFEFVRKHLGEIIEVRFVLNTAPPRAPEVITALANGLQGVRTPSLVRTDTQLKLPKVDQAHPSTIVETIKSFVSLPIKVSGNVNFKMIQNNDKVNRYAVDIQQLQSIIRDLETFKQQSVAK